MTNVNDAVAQRIATAHARIEATRRRRATQQAARDKGLAQRHAAKLRAQANPRRVATPGAPEGDQHMPQSLTSPADLMTQRIIDAAQPQPAIEELWTAAYPTMRVMLDGIIRGRRSVAAGAEHFVQLRRSLGQLDRGTYKPCTRSRGCGPADSPISTMALLRDVLALVPVGSPAAGLLYRLASVVAVEAAKRVDELRSRGTRPAEGGQR